MVALDWTGHLGWDYLRPLFGTLEGGGGAQWQFAFILAPIPITLGALAVLISKFPRPSLRKLFVVVSWVAAIVPAMLYILVLGLHAYVV